MDLDITIAGLGARTPLGSSLAQHMAALAAARSAIGPPRRALSPEVTQAPVCEVDFPDDDPRPKYVALAADAGADALATAGIGAEAIDLLVVGTCNGPRTGLDWRLGDRPVPARTIEGDDSASRATAAIADSLGIGGRCLTVSTACSAGAAAVAHAWHFLRTGAASTALCIGIDELWLGSQLSFEMIRALSADGCDPYGRSDGTTLGEAAAAIVLHAQTDRTSSPRYGYLRGVGQSADAFHPAVPDPTAEGPWLAVERALRLAGPIDDVDLVAGHGTGTRANDRMEQRLAERLATYLGRAPADAPPTFSTKGQHGHTVGACGILELDELVLALAEHADLATAAFLEGTRPFKAGGDDWVGLKNSFAMGGLNTSILVSSQPAGSAAVRVTGQPRVLAAAAAEVGGLRLAGQGSPDPWSLSFAELQAAMERQSLCRRPRWETFDTLTTLTAYLVAGLLAATSPDTGLDRSGLGLLVGTERGPARLWHQFTAAVEHGGEISPAAVPNMSRHALASNTCDVFGMRGVTSVFYHSAGDHSPVLAAAVAALRAGAAPALVVLEVDERAGDGLDGHLARGCLLVSATSGVKGGQALPDPASPLERVVGHLLEGAGG